MNASRRYKLIDSEYTPDKASHVLLSLVKSKIDYHNVEKLSSTERFGEDVTRSEQRLAELLELREELRAACISAEEEGATVRVNGWIEIETVPPENGEGSASDTRKAASGPGSATS